MIRDGDQIAIFSATTLVRALTVDPTREYQPIAPNHPHLPHPRTPTSIMTCQRCPETLSVNDVPRHHNAPIATSHAEVAERMTADSGRGYSVMSQPCEAKDLPAEKGDVVLPLAIDGWKLRPVH